MNSQERCTVTVVIPAFNEKRNLARLSRQVLLEPWSSMLVLDALIIVDDCSDDGTAAEADRLAADFSPVRAVHHARREGKNAGIRDGIASCTSDIIVLLDADVTLVEGCVVETVRLLVDDVTLAAASCVNDPLPSRSWRERASRFQALIVAELSRRGCGSLLRVYALRMSSIVDLQLPDTAADDLYIPRWLHDQGACYAVNPRATVRMRSATGLRDFAKQTVRAWSALQALQEVLPDTTASVCGGRREVTCRALASAVLQEPIGFLLYIVWRGVIAVVPARHWLPSIDYSRHNTSLSTKSVDESEAEGPQRRSRLQRTANHDILE